MEFNFSCKSAKKGYIIPVDGVNKGTIPKWIKGTLYRNGPGKFEVGADKYQHFFDGLAMIQRYYINDGKVVFNSQYIHSNTYLKNMAANRIVVSEFGTVACPDPCRNIFDRFSSVFKEDFTDNTLVCVYPIGDELFTATETHVINRIDPDDLSTIGSVRLPTILSIHRATAHHHIDAKSGQVYLLGFVNHPIPSYAMVTLPPIKKEESSSMKEKYDMEKLLTEAKIIGKINARWKWNPSYCHSFGMTENYFIIFECPLALSILDMFKAKLTSMSHGKALKWWPQEKTIIHIMNKITGEVLPHTYITDPFFTFHHINAYEENDHVVIDYCAYDDGSIISDLYLNTEESATSNYQCLPRRLVVPVRFNEKSPCDKNLVSLTETTCTAHILSISSKPLIINCKQEDLLLTSSMELPTINYNAYNGKKYQYMYAVHRNNVIKINVVTKSSTVWSNDVELSCTCESLFVKNPLADDNNPEDEDYGVLLCPVIIMDEEVDTGRYQSLVFIDAKSMKELGRAEFPSVSIPFSLHGIFKDLN